MTCMHRALASCSSVLELFLFIYLRKHPWLIPSFPNPVEISFTTYNPFSERQDEFDGSAINSWVGRRCSCKRVLFAGYIYRLGNPRL
jgi:hypothetical protein